MARRLREQLDDWGHRLFVGRQAELALFQSLLDTDDGTTHILFIHGPFGVGKTTLLKEFAFQCHTAGLPSNVLDGQHAKAIPDAFQTALRGATGGSGGETPAGQPGRYVLFIDGYDALSKLDDWVIDSFIPDLPENVLLVIAGRDPPTTRWRIQPALRALMRSCALNNLTTAEIGAFLELCNIPPDQHEPIARFTHGHPLALALVADHCAHHPDVPFRPEAAIDVVHTLLDHLIQDVPTAVHRAALDASSLVRVLTEPLLADLLALKEAHELFEWLRNRPFIESDATGIFPTELAREILALDLRWRNPDQLATMRQRAHAHYLRHVAISHGNNQEQPLIDYAYLYRDSPTPPSQFAPLALSYPSFVDAVHDGLRHLLEPEALVGNPLLQSRIVLEHIVLNGGSTARVTVLQSILKQTAEELRASPRSNRCYRALYHTYIAPAPTQEQAAEVLDLPYSTFRRHLKEGIDRMTTLLWQREIGELPVEGPPRQV